MEEKWCPGVPTDFRRIVAAGTFLSRWSRKGTRTCTLKLHGEEWLIGSRQCLSHSTHFKDVGFFLSVPSHPSPNKTNTHYSLRPILILSSHLRFYLTSCLIHFWVPDKASAYRKFLPLHTFRPIMLIILGDERK